MCNSKSGTDLYIELEQCRLFKDVPADTLKEIAEFSTFYTLKKGAPLPFRRQNEEYVYIIRSGYVHLYLPLQSTGDKNKDENRFFVGWCGPDQLLGEMEALVDKKDRFVDDPAAEVKSHETCCLIAIPKEALIKVADRTATIYRNLCVLLIEKTVHQRRRAQAIQMRAGVPQFAQALLNLYEERGHDKLDKARKIKGIITQGELAGYLGLGRTSATNYLTELRKRGAISTQGKSTGNMSAITILNLRKLKECLNLAFDK